MDNYSKIRKIVQRVIFDNDGSLAKDWEKYYQEQSDTANKYLVDINLVLFSMKQAPHMK